MGLRSAHQILQEVMKQAALPAMLSMQSVCVIS